MPEASPNPARGAQPGKFQRPKVRPVTFAGSGWTWASTRTPTGGKGGDLFHDAELTEPTGLTIVEIID